MQPIITGTGWWENTQNCPFAGFCNLQGHQSPPRGGAVGMTQHCICWGSLAICPKRVPTGTHPVNRIAQTQSFFSSVTWFNYYLYLIFTTLHLWHHPHCWVRCQTSLTCTLARQWWKMCILIEKILCGENWVKNLTCGEKMMTNVKWANLCHPENVYVWCISNET